MGYQPDTVLISSCLMIHSAVTGQCPKYIRDIIHLYQYYLGGTGFKQLASSTSPGYELFSVKELSPWLVHASGTLFHNTLQISQTEELLNELLRDYFKLAYDC